MPAAALSTMWSQQDRFFTDLRDFARVARSLGYDALEVNYVVTRERVEQLLDGAELPIASFHAPSPRVKHSDGRWSEQLNLASTDESERRQAVAYNAATFEWAERAGARRVVLHLGGVGSQMMEPERRLRRLFDSGVRDGAEVEGLRDDLRRLRREQQGPYLEAARRTLAELAEEASRRGLTLGLENRYHYHEIPQPEESRELLAAYPPELVGHWHDVGHAEVLHRLGLIDRERWLRELGPRTVGCHLHDVDGIGDHRAPGRGDVQWDYIARGLPPAALRVFEIDQRQPDDALAAAIDYLRARAVV
jgi:sugar phosphate isomerase/epimerase